MTRNQVELEFIRGRMDELELGQKVLKSGRTMPCSVLV